MLQVKETYTILISRPWRTYGAEMDVNEFGVAIGNVAVFTKEPYEEKGILGTDMARLALERTRSAKEVLKFLTNLIEDYGQGGNYSYEKKFKYHNSFIVADPREAWVLKTAGRYWIAKKVVDIYSISNALTIDGDWDLAHDDVMKHGVSKHRCSQDDFSFARCYSDKLYTWAAKGRERRSYTYRRLLEKRGELTPWDLMSILRAHSFESYTPSKGSMMDICMRYGEVLRPSQTASSTIFVLCSWGYLALVTGASNPCISMYKPLVHGMSLLGGKCSNKYSEECYWWRFEELHGG